VPVWGRGCSDALVDEPREEARIDRPPALLRVIGCGRLRGDDLVPTSPLPLQRGDILPHPDQHVPKLFKLGLVANRLTVPGDDDRARRRRREIEVARDDGAVEGKARNEATDVYVASRRRRRPPADAARAGSRALLAGRRCAAGVASLAALKPVEAPVEGARPHFRRILMTSRAFILDVLRRIEERQTRKRSPRRRRRRRRDGTLAKLSQLTTQWR
jgi:hypothetical protein